MKLLLITFMFAAMFTKTTTEEMHMDYYKQKSRFEVIRKYYMPKVAVFMGDSITAYYDLPERNGYKIYNKGYPSKTTSYLLSKLDDTLKLKPHRIYIMIGINDIALGVPNDEIIENYKLILDTIKEQSPQTEVYIQSILPVGQPRGLDENDIIYINNELKKLNYPYIDLYSLFDDGNGYMQQQYTYDQVHLNEKGYQVWTNKINSIWRR